MDGIRTEHIHPLLPDHVTDRASSYTAHKGVLNHDGILTSADVVIALKLAVNGGWDSAVDVDGDDRITSLGRAHDPAGGGWRNHTLTRRRPHNQRGDKSYEYVAIKRRV